MKRLLLLFATILPLAAAAQSDSTAARIVDRYLKIMNIDALPADSMLVVNTQIVYPATGDTFNMRRLYAQPMMFRVEVRDSKGKLQTGFCSNGKNRYRSFSPEKGWWRDIPAANFYNRFKGFDIRGPLYTWRTDNAYITYRGRTEYKGQQLEVVHYSAPGFFKRLYMFEESGLLSVILEEDSIDGDYEVPADAHIDWKCIHEYTMVGPALLPSVESFMRKELLTVMRSEMHLEKRDNLQFNQD